MTQHFRVCKPKIGSIVRNYGSQRYQQNYYEILKVSSDASQEDIKQAFLKLSKQLHPDTSGKQSHTDFVKLNEAYSVIGKASTRSKYDKDLKYRHVSYPSGYSQNRQYGSMWEYEVRTAGGTWPPPKRNRNPYLGLTVSLLILSLSMLHFMFLMYSMKVRKHSQLRSSQIQRQYQYIRDTAHDQSNSTYVTNLNESLTKDDN